MIHAIIKQIFACADMGNYKKFQTLEVINLFDVTLMKIVLINYSITIIN
jgi:hypothetical protein